MFEGIDDSGTELARDRLDIVGRGA